MFNYNIFKINKNKLLLANKYKLNVILQILRDNKKEILIKKENFQKFIKNYFVNTILLTNLTKKKTL